MAELLQTDTLSAQQSDRVKRLSQSANSLLGLVNDILDFSKIEANRMAIEEIPFRMRDIESAVCNFLRPAAAKKHLDLTWSLDASAAGVFIGDSTRIRQVLINLVSNAIKFTEVGSVSVKISWEGHSDENGSLIFEVKDTGIGISAEQIGRLFEPFVQADEGTARKFGGTGLGLAITRRLVEAMGGEISVRSKLGDGSTFRVVMPARAAEEGTLAEAPDDVAAQAGRAKRTGHVLVAEDVETSRYLLESMLSRMGHTVEAIAHGSGRECTYGCAPR